MKTNYDFLKELKTQGQLKPLMLTFGLPTHYSSWMEYYEYHLPPLALQQTFAAQIEAIEQQKALIRRSLDDTRTLLAARMQYYFE